TRCSPFPYTTLFRSTSILCRGSSNSDIGGAVEHCLHHLMAQTFTEFDIDVGMCRQVARENVGHELIHGRRIGTHLHQALNSARKFLHLAPQVFQLPHHHTGMTQKRVPRGGQRNALTASEEYWRTQPLLQILHSATGSG